MSSNFVDDAKALSVAKVGGCVRAGQMAAALLCGKGEESPGSAGQGAG